MTTPKLLTVDEVASILRLSRVRVYQLLRAGVLPQRRLTARGRLYVLHGDVLRFLRGLPADHPAAGSAATEGAATEGVKP